MTQRKHFRAALFDMDGTLFDTEVIYRDAWLSAGVPEDLYLTFIGAPRSRIKQLLADHGLDPEAIYVYKDQFVSDALKDHIPVKPGVEACLQWLKEQGISCAVATSSSIETARKYVSRAGLDGYFAQVISGNQVEHGKPAPDVFLFAARQLGASPEETVVLEDSYNGIRAGHAAGMYTIMIPDAVAPDDEMQALSDVILTSLAEVPKHLQNLD